MLLAPMKLQYLRSGPLADGLCCPKLKNEKPPARENEQQRSILLMPVEIGFEPTDDLLVGLNCLVQGRHPF
jgi:hypothetical protein